MNISVNKSQPDVGQLTFILDIAVGVFGGHLA
jgi:hypothetical protein